jgi:hypothetical protein
MDAPRPARTGTAGAIAIAIALAGCGKTVIDGNKVQDQIKKEASASPFNLDVSEVNCPQARPAKKGDVFQCTMTLKDGEKVNFNIEQTDSKGHVLIHLANEIATFVQSTIDARFAARGAQVTSTCPRHVPVVAGANFDCTFAAAGGRHGTVQITITDTSGGFELGRVHLAR